VKYCSKCKNNIYDSYLVCETCEYNSCKSCAGSNA